MVSSEYDYDIEAYKHYVHKYNMSTNELSQTRVPLSQNSAYYMSDVNKFLCFNSSKVYSINPDSTGYTELYNHETFNYSQFSCPVNYGHKFLVLDQGLNLVLVDTADTTKVTIGQVSHQSNFIGGSGYRFDICKNNKYIFFVNSGNIIRYNIETNVSDVILSLSSHSNPAKFNSICSTPDGSKVFMIKDL